VAGVAAEIVQPPAMYPADLWQGRTQALVRVMDRLDSHVELLTIPVDGAAVHKTLTIAVHRCVDRPQTLPGDAAVQATMTDSHPDTVPFDGWMVASLPSLSMLQSALYDVRVVGCAGDVVAPQVGPVPQPKVPEAPPVVQGADTGGPVPLTPGDEQGRAQDLTPPSAGQFQSGQAQSGPVPLTPGGRQPQEGTMDLTPPSAPPSTPAAPGGTLPPPQPWQN